MNDAASNSRDPVRRGLGPGARAVGGIAGILLAGCVAPRESGRLLQEQAHLLGGGERREWAEFEALQPREPRLGLRFQAEAAAHEQTLYIRQDDVKQTWRVTLNGQALGPLHRQELPTVWALRVPPGTLRTGENLLELVPPREPDDILIGPIRLDPRPLEVSVGEATLEVVVTDRAGGGGLPSRITIVDARGALPPVLARPSPDRPQRVAVRPGVVYTADGRARVSLPAGAYTVHAGRGFEYSVDERRIVLRPGDVRSVRLAIRREVPTPGLVAADTHVHTLFFSGHGDASDEERVLTLAGEGIELPIVTEHNQHSGYDEAARRLGLRPHFTPVVGNEVTTPQGHFNIFPVVPGSPVPDHRITDWPRLMEILRGTPGVQVVILNHPRNLHTGYVPFAPANFDAVTGRSVHGTPFTFDAIELVNSGTLRSDPMDVYRDWFALLNHGDRIFGVGSSDCHDVNRFIVGQGRTYVAAPDDDPGAVDVARAARSFREGRVLVSMGLLVQLAVDDRFSVGDLATGLGSEVKVTATVLGPSWARAERVELYANGIRIAEARVRRPEAGGQKHVQTWRLPRPRHDVHLVAIATGPGVRALYWPIPRPQQPTSPAWDPYVIASTNPIWLDGDGDGTFLAPRGQAAALVRHAGPDLPGLVSRLGAHDEAVAIQAASLLRDAGVDLNAAPFRQLVASAASPVQRAFSVVGRP